MNLSEMREQRRADRAAERAETRADEAARREQDRTDRAERERRREQRRSARADRVRGGLRWLTAHPVALLMSTVIVVPALLAWSAMAAYGQGLYGPVGTLLPLFTECAMWAFAARAQQAKQHGQPTWVLHLGTWLFTTVAATLNFTHGAAVAGPSTGAVMATVSVGGVVVHQLVQACDRVRRTRGQRRADRRARLAQRRAHRMELAATRQAAGQVRPDGSVALLVQPGTVTTRRCRWAPWRTQVVYGPVPGLGADGPDTPAPGVAAEVEQWLATDPETAGPGPADLGRDRGQDTPEPAAETGGNAPVPGPRAWSWDELVAAFWAAVADGSVTPSSQRNIRLRLRCSRDRARDLAALYRDTHDDGGGAAAPAA